MLLKVKTFQFSTGRPVAILNRGIAEILNVHISERIYVHKKNSKKMISAIVDILDCSKKTCVLGEKEIALSNEITQRLNLREGEFVEVKPQEKLTSSFLIKQKLSGEELSKEEIKKIIYDISHNKLTEVEIAYFVSGIYTHKLTDRELYYLIRAIADTGEKLKYKKKIILDKHCIGGLAGNRTTPLIVSIVSAAIDKYKLNAIFPKTSSRAITSAAGTADVMETLTKVDLSISQMEKVLKKINSCLVWGGSLRLAPADDKIIRVERVISLDPEMQLIASILSKKLSVNATHVLIDIPYGKFAKVSYNEAKRIKKNFIKMARKFNLKLKVVFTDGNKPVGNGIGPNLEARDIISVLTLSHSRPRGLEKKSLMLASELLFLSEKFSKKESKEVSREMLYSGLAFKKFLKILKAQDKNFSFERFKKLSLGKFRKEILAWKKGKIILIENKKINALARMAGCPSDRSAGIYLWKHVGDEIKKGQKILTIFAETKQDLDSAYEFYKKTKPVLIG